VAVTKKKYFRFKGKKFEKINALPSKKKEKTLGVSSLPALTSAKSRESAGDMQREDVNKNHFPNALGTGPLWRPLQ